MVIDLCDVHRLYPDRVDRAFEFGQSRDETPPT
jgi:hypothetical protein